MRDVSGVFSLYELKAIEGALFVNRKRLEKALEYKVDGDERYKKSRAVTARLHQEFLNAYQKKQMNDDLQAKIEKLERELAELKKKDNQWPQMDDEHYYLTNGGSFEHAFCPFSDTYDASRLDRCLIKRGNFFKTEREATTFRNAFEELMKLRIMTGGIDVKGANFQYGNCVFRHEDGKEITQDEHLMLTSCLRTLLKHHPADDVAKELFDKEDGEN